MLNHRSLWAALGPLVMRARLELLELLEAHDQALAIDCFFALLFGAAAAALWCCCLRSAQDVTLALLKILAFVVLGAVATNVALLIVNIAAHEHEHVGLLLNTTMEAAQRHFSTSLFA